MRITKDALALTILFVFIIVVMAFRSDPFQDCVRTSPGADADIAYCADLHGVPCAESQGTRIEGKRARC